MHVARRWLTVRHGHWRIGRLAWLLAVGLSMIWVGAAAAADKGIERVVADATGIVLDVALDPLTIQGVQGADGQPYTQVGLAGFESAGWPGQPMLPMRSVMLAAPPGAALRVTATVLAEEERRLSAPILPASTWQPDELAANGVREVFAADAVAYASAAWSPTALAVLDEAGVMRGVRLATLTLQPVQYHAASQTLRFVSRMRVTVQFVGAATSGAALSAPDASGFAELLRQTVINPEYVAAWRVSDPPVGASTAPAGLPLERTRYRIPVQQTGVYQLTYADLLAAGLPLDGLDPRRLQLYQGDQELAIEVSGEADGRFDPEDVLRFYAEQVRSLYTDTNTVWLAIGDAPGKRMVARSVVPTAGQAASSFADTQHFEVNRVYRSAMPMASDVDHWFWGQMFIMGAARSLTMTAPFTITAPAPAAGPAMLTLSLWGASSDARVDPDHRVRASINGTVIGEVTWDGAVNVEAQLPFDHALLRPGGNTLTLFTPADTGARDAVNRSWEVNWLDFFKVTYQRGFVLTDGRLAFNAPTNPAHLTITGWPTQQSLAYDVTEPSAPIRLTGATMTGASGNYALHLSDTAAVGSRYFVAAPAGLLAPLGVTADPPSGLRTEAVGADYLVIAHGDFVAGIQPLVDHRRSQGLRVRVVDVQDIYDEFSGGLLDPHAIRAFIAYAYFNWPAPAPAYVLLVGDGTYDFMNREGYGARNFVPPFLAAVDPLMGETAADNRYVAVDGADILPDLHLGRFPVNTQEELAAMVNKTVAYETTPTPGDWRTRAVFVADNPDAAGQFGALSDAVVGLLPPEFAVERIYLGSAEYPVSEALRAQQAVLDAFNAGSLLFNYVGHSSITNWAAELLFSVNQLSQVANGSRWPIVLPMTCLEGTYHNPRYAGLAESSVRLAGRGALASWSATGQGVASGHDYIHRGFYAALFNWDVRVLGDATTAGLVNLYVNAHFPDGTPRYRDLIDTYVLLGDPATRIGVAPADLSLTAAATSGVLMAGDPVTYTLHYRNLGSVLVKGVEIAADLPDGLVGVAWQATDPALTLRAGANLTWDLAQLAAGAAGQITVTGRIGEQQPPGRLALSAEMRISSRWAEVSLADNRAGPFVVDLAPADLALGQIIEPAGPVTMGQQVTFTLAFVNLGPATATGVSLTLPLPVALTDLRVFQAGTTATLRAGTQYVLDLSAIPAGAKGRVTVTGRVPYSLTWDQVVWSVTPRIGATWPERDLANNHAAEGVVVVDVGDLFEPDDTPALATRIEPAPAMHPHVYDTVGDQDWVVFRAQAGMRYLIRTLNLGPGGDTVLFLRDAQGNLLAKNDDAFPGTRASAITWQAPATQDYYVMVTSSNPTAGFSYSLQVTELPFTVLLPLMRSSQAAH